LQLSTEKAKQEENDGIVALRILRIQVRKITSGYSSDGRAGELCHQTLEMLYLAP